MQPPTRPRRSVGWNRAHRMAPNDGTVSLALGSAWLARRTNGPPEEAADAVQNALQLFEAVAAAHGTVEAWVGIATCAHVQGRPDAARMALDEVLHRSIPTGTITALANAVAGPSGWCGLSTDGTIHKPANATIRLDDTLLSPKCSTLLAGWRSCRTLTIEGPDGPLIGSGLPIRHFAGVDAFVEATPTGIAGWAWRAADPMRHPTLDIEGPNGRLVLTPTILANDDDEDRPLARPRRFTLATADIATLGSPLSVRGPDGRHIIGSPLVPDLEARGGPAFTPTWADRVGPPPPHARRAAAVDVIVPVHGGGATAIACLDSVLATLPRGTRLIVVDDASPDSALTVHLDTLQRRRRITLIRLPDNRGFPAAANEGLRAAAGRDAVLLNSDTLVPPGWLERLRAAAYRSPDTGTATPLTNDGTIVSYPDRDGGNPPPDLAGTVATDAIAQAANPGQTAELPVGVGFCLYIRRDCLDQTGPLREDVFAQGYGEENDFCLRARHSGWRHVAALDVFVAHVGGASFGAARRHLIRRNSAILNRLHPGYEALVAAHLALDPLAAARHRMDALRWTRARTTSRSVVLITHAGGGGVDQVIERRAAAITLSGRLPIILRPTRDGVRIDERSFPNLVFAMPQDLPALAAMLRKLRPERLELHHMLGHHQALAGLAARLRIPQTSVIHDYAHFCGRIGLIGPERRYCGEPDVAGCEACIADQGSLLEDDPSVPELLGRSAAQLAASDQIIVPSLDTAHRIRRHFPAIAPAVEPWEDDAAYPPIRPARPASPLLIAVVGAIGIEKGYDVLLACVRDAKARALPLTYVVVGFTMDDERLLAAGPVFVTGNYAEAEAITLIRKQRAQIALIPSIFPETWCFALSRAWQAGLATAVFDIGAQAERVRRTGRGWVLPLGLSPRALNDALLRLAPDAPPGQCPPDLAYPQAN